MTDMPWEVLALAGTAVVGIAFACLTAVLAKLSGDEVSGWLPVWSARLLESAVSIIPSEYRDRYRKEWQAELAAFQGRRLSGLRFAWRLRRRARSTHEALCESDGLGEVFDSETPPIEIKPLDPEVVAAIVRRAVDKTKPQDHHSGEDFIEVLVSSLSGLEIGDLPAEITQRYLLDVRDWREQERSARRAEAGDWGFEDLPGLSGQSPLEIARDVAHRQRASELRRRSSRRQRFPFSYWL